jgi:hypothetical protein
VEAEARVNRAVTVSLLAAMALGGCQCGTVELDIPSDTTVTVPGTGIGLPGNPLVPDEVFPTADIGDLLGQQVSNSLDTSGYKKEAVQSLTLTKMALTAITPDDGSPDRGLGFFQSITMFVGDDKVEVAHSKDGAFDGDPGPEKVDMELTGTDFNDQFQQSDELKVDADVEVADPPTFDTDVKFEFVITAVVDALQAI